MRTGNAHALTEDERALFIQLAAAMVDAQAEERLAAYSAGYDAGYAEGLEDGLRQLLDDARLALGRAA
jgi:hypothetical protein